MTTPSADRGPVSVEPMTDSLGRLLDRARQAQVLQHTWINVRVDDLADLLVRAPPLPRRYTGGPLEDGLYLWRRHRWHRPDWESVAVEDGTAHSDHEMRTLPGVDGWLHDPVWLIGPIHIPEIPSEEASS